MTVASLGGEGQSEQPRRSESTLNRRRSTYRAFLRWAFETGKIRENPAVRLRLARLDSPPARSIAVAETSLLLRAIRNSADPLRQAILPAAAF